METRMSQDRVGSGDVEEGFDQHEQYHSHQTQTTTTTTTSGGSKERPRGTSSSSLKGKLVTARAILGISSMILAIAILGVVGYMVGKFGDIGFAHVSLVFVGITAISTLLWHTLDFTTLLCLRDRFRTLYPGAYVGVHICISLACIATIGYVGIWVSTADEEADRDLDLEPDDVDIPPIVEALATKYQTAGRELRGRRGQLYRLGITLLVITVIMLLINFVLAILACREVRRKDAVREERDIDPADPARYQIPAGRKTRQARGGAPRSRVAENQFPGYVVTVNDAPVTVSRPPPAMTGAMPHRAVDLGVEISPGAHEDWNNMKRDRSGSPTDIDLTPVSPGSSEMTEVLTEKDSGIWIGRRLER
ncbi:hypothetical protein QBC32DRAFT_163441 [Pseudoneurospora amorphoporcata]|uniref:Uncharacterized protein n=1 Tax=Pseudoneurospora amorphoporcata TaxID=241081 RepID=A0AAN6NX00_9PEZI|nr:hypothetical protein QBC32DRAFT_163441 [Pseudoneurospora amorphoporcata]